MSNLGTVLKAEITRLARRALRAELVSLRRGSTQHRRQIAELKRQVAALERTLRVVARGAAARPARAEAQRQPARFVAKGLRSQRARLGLSAADFGKLAGVSAQTIYNWERDGAHPGAAQLARLVALRGIGKREAARQLAAADPGRTAKRRRKRAG